MAKEFVTINFDKVYLGEVLGSNGQEGYTEYRRINLPDGSSFIRKAEQVKQSEYAENEVYFQVPADFTFKVSTSHKDQETGEYVNDSKDITVAEVLDQFKNPSFYETVSDFATITFDKKRLVDVFSTKEGHECTVIMVTNDTKIIRKSEQVKAIEDDNERVKIFLPKNYEMQAKQLIHDENEYHEENVKLDVDTLKRLMEEDLQGFVKFIVPKSDVSEPHFGENDTSFCFINVPGVGSFIRNSENIKEVKANDEKVMFYIPAGSKIKVRYSRKVAGAPDDAPNDKKYVNEEKMYDVLDLKRKINNAMQSAHERENSERTQVEQSSSEDSVGDGFMSMSDFIGEELPFPTKPPMSGRKGR